MICQFFIRLLSRCICNDLDSHPKKRHPLNHNKQLGDPSYIPNTQYFGNYVAEQFEEALITFTKLAKRYIIEGDSRYNICSRNAEVCSCYDTNCISKLTVHCERSHSMQASPRLHKFGC